MGNKFRGCSLDLCTKSTQDFAYITKFSSRHPRRGRRQVSAFCLTGGGFRDVYFSQSLPLKSCDLKEALQPSACWLLSQLCNKAFKDTSKNASKCKLQQVLLKPLQGAARSRENKMQSLPWPLRPYRLWPRFAPPAHLLLLFTVFGRMSLAVPWRDGADPAAGPSPSPGQCPLLGVSSHWPSLPRLFREDFSDQL